MAEYTEGLQLECGHWWYVMAELAFKKEKQYIMQNSYCMIKHPPPPHTHSHTHTHTHTHTHQVYHGPGAMATCHSSLCGEGQRCPLHALQLHGCPSTCSHTGGQIHDVQVGTQGRCGSLYVPELEVTHTHMHTHTHTHTHTHSHAHTLTHTHSHTHTLFCY